MTAFHTVLAVTLVLLFTLMALGLKLQLGSRPPGRRRDPPRRIHHVLYFLVTLGTLASGVLALFGHLVWWPFVPLLALLLSMSRTRPGNPAHWRLATATALLYSAAAWWVW
ncbi:hypothetical protein Q0M94_07685 [Deinococcus radiomollis]|uniref:hypothetical protein n=1 Tax=Deinococcus radiomollis TaxID=468916 RepID=UPI003892AE95